MATSKTIPSKSAAAQAAVADGKKVEVKAMVKNGKMRGRNVTVLLDADDIVKEQVGGFVTFLREHAIIGLAIGFVVGTQTQAVVKQLISSFIDPAFQLFFGGAKLSERTFILHLWDNTATFGWGIMAQSLLNLLFVLAVIYALIKILKLDKLDLPKNKEAGKPKAKAKKTPKKK